ncbi:hypothetical protein ABT010_13545 [Streptomyces sp. NPDC002668]|uniref:hypothetical protein n=1 Tax=Streptomyces sp. NPDC002668 TaxID=3154422 RepID=UPI00332F08A9
MPRRIVRRLGRRLGRRGAFLVCFGTVWSLIGYGQITSPPPDQRGLKLLTDILPLQVWGWLWFTAGLVAIVSAWMPQGWDWPGFLALPLIVLPWFFAYLLAWWPLGVFPRGWIAAALYGALAIGILVVAGWREPRQPKREAPPYDS